MSPDPQTSRSSPVPDWTALFVEAVQAERQRREEHTADLRLSIEQYTAAAEQKIREALGVHGPALASLMAADEASAGAPSSLASRPRTRAR